MQQAPLRRHKHTSWTPVAYLVVLGGDWRRGRGHLRLSLGVTIVRGGMRWLVAPVRCSRSSCCHGNGRGSGYGNSGCGGRVGCCHGVCCYRRLVNGVTGHCGWMRVRHPSCWLMTDGRKRHHQQTDTSQAGAPGTRAQPCWRMKGVFCFPA